LRWLTAAASLTPRMRAFQCAAIQITIRLEYLAVDEEFT
jgi:hypothetical protein